MGSAPITLGQGARRRLSQGRVNGLLTLNPHTAPPSPRQATTLAACRPAAGVVMPATLMKQHKIRCDKEMTRGLGGPRVKARLAREGSRRGVLRAGQKKNVSVRGRFRAHPEKMRAPWAIALTSRRPLQPPTDLDNLLNLRSEQWNPARDQ